MGDALLTRMVRLVSLSSSYADIVLETTGLEWSWDFPIRQGLARRNALIEIDALAAISFGLKGEELTTLYRTQFPVLRGYEQNDLYDSNGRKLPNAMNKLYRKAGEEGMTVEDRTWVHPQSAVEYVFEFPFKGVDREEDMRAAYEKFNRMLEEHGRIIEDED